MNIDSLKAKGLIRDSGQQMVIPGKFSLSYSGLGRSHATRLPSESRPGTALSSLRSLP
jgi:hypothetical protein